MNLPEQEKNIGEKKMKNGDIVSEINKIIEELKKLLKSANLFNGLTC